MNDLQPGEMSAIRDYAAGLLRGAKVRLRSLREEDTESLASWWNEPEWAVFQSTKVVPAPAAATVEMFQAWSKNKDAGGVGFSIEKIDDGTLLGHVALWGIDPTIRAASLGIMIGTPHVGQGFGTDTMKIILRFAFEELGLNKIELNVWEYNTRALRTYKSAGFVVEGTRRAAAFHAGRYWAQIQMGILRSEFLEMH
ncbi:GNAT family N-acetyltransferase [Acaricomes phytoseiuli]|uniref:GNAT family N-acetyltransferase n=1 Tax=Acaricomes phytoseiuli TaxID=291968 RepID=UPI00037E72EC|nr:GNAT family protein [Acaricomes phytoseiuli]MCW1249978.1 GNAT family N-acetyltransferase [Acaricomes phytoseiuli]